MASNCNAEWARLRGTSWRGGFVHSVSGEPLADEALLEWSDIPPGIPQSIGAGQAPGHAVWRMHCSDARGKAHDEWWWLDADGELIEAFWFD
jgi:hypothetical protein